MLKQKRPTKSTRQLASPRAPHAPEEGTKSEQGGVCWRPGGACGTHTCHVNNKVLSVRDAFNRRPREEEALQQQPLHHPLRSMPPDGQKGIEHRHHRQRRLPAGRVEENTQQDKQGLACCR